MHSLRNTKRAIPKPAKHRAGQPGIEILREPGLAQVPWLIHGFSTRVGGFSTAYGAHSLNLGFTNGDRRPAVEKNRRAFADALNAEPGQPAPRLVTLKQTHSDRVHLVGGHSENIAQGDAMVSNLPGLLLAIQTADCLPILLVDTTKRVIAAIHAGWRGTLNRIAQKTVGAMQSQYDSAPSDILAAIGPGIHQCCYAVGADLRQEFESQFEYAAELFDEVFDSDPVHLKYPLLFLTARAPGHGELGPQTHLDLVAGNRRQLRDAGIPEGNIFSSPLCTACRTDLLFSHRAEHGNTGRMMAAIAIRQGEADHTP